VLVEGVAAEGALSLPVGSSLSVQASVRLGSLLPEDVTVDLYEGPLDQQDNIVAPTLTAMAWDGTHDDGRYRFVGTVECHASGQHGYTVRVVPHHPDHPDRFVEGLLRWAESPA
jgi:starch phosphorylase